MALRASLFKKVFQFNFKARTSRGLIENKTSWFVKLWDEMDPATFGLGECGPLPGLSLDATPDFEATLLSIMHRVNRDHYQVPSAFDSIFEIIPFQFPSIVFGFETAWHDLTLGGIRTIFKNDFLKGNPIPINGLIWMDTPDLMMEQVHAKVEQGFTCIKLKVGGLDFANECKLLKRIRQQYSSEKITIRLDANGAFLPADAHFKLQRLSEFDIHSIEQPLREGDNEMANLCRISPIPIALDEELIKHQAPESRREVLERILPKYIILKPTLHGGLRGCQDWITTAERLGIGWWITSALESNIGLNAVCQFTANYNITIPQGLGTGAIYRNNFGAPLRTKSGTIFMDPSATWDLQSINYV